MTSEKRCRLLELRLKELKRAQIISHQTRREWASINSKIESCKKGFEFWQKQKSELMNNLTNGSIKGIDKKEESWSYAAIIEEILCTILWYTEKLKTHQREFRTLIIKSQAALVQLIMSNVGDDL